MRRAIIIIVVVAIVGAGGWWAYNYFQEQQAAEQAALDAEQAATASDLEQVIWASGNLQPLEWAGLAPANSGTIEEINVAEGDEVEAGNLLLELENGVLESQVRVAEAALGEAEAALAKLRAGATEADIAAAEAAIEVGQGPGSAGRQPDAGRSVGRRVGPSPGAHGPGPVCRSRQPSHRSRRVGRPCVDCPGRSSAE